jgi:hypothetical protein
VDSAFRSTRACGPSSGCEPRSWKRSFAADSSREQRKVLLVSACREVAGEDVALVELGVESSPRTTLLLRVDVEAVLHADEAADSLHKAGVAGAEATA